MTSKQIQTTPELRFPEFKGVWLTNRVDYYLDRHNDPVNVEVNTLYRQIGVRSHGRGVFHKDKVSGASLGAKRVFWVHSRAFVVNIVFGWEQAVALTSESEEGFIASHRFPMFLPKENRADLSFLLTFFLRKRGKYLLGLASPGGAGRNKTLGQNEFARLEVSFPRLEEQQKITAFLGAVDDKLTALRRKRELLQEYKRGMMQKIFFRKLRFKGDDGADFPDWVERRLGEVSVVLMGQSPPSTSYNDNGVGLPLIQGNADVKNGYSVPRQYTSEPSKICELRDIILSVRAPVGEVAISNHNAAIGRGVCLIRETNESTNGFLFQWLLWFEKKWIRVGQGSTFAAISGKDIREMTLNCPDRSEQKLIADFLSAIDSKIEAVAGQIAQVEIFKKGLLQKMFV